MNGHQLFKNRPIVSCPFRRPDRGIARDRLTLRTLDPTPAGPLAVIVGDDGDLRKCSTGPYGLLQVPGAENVKFSRQRDCAASCYSLTALGCRILRGADERALPLLLGARLSSAPRRRPRCRYCAHPAVARPLPPVLAQDDFQILAQSWTWQKTLDGLWTPNNEHAMPLGRLLTFAVVQLAGRPRRCRSPAC